MMNPGNIKQQLHQLCLLKVEERMRALQSANETARSAQQEDTKSSAGDKYETAREMMTQELEKNAQLLAEVLFQKQQLLQTPVHFSGSVVQPGSCVFTNTGNFYIAVSAGALQIEEGVFQSVSVASPIGKMLMSRKPGDKISFNGKEYIIKEVW